MHFHVVDSYVDTGSFLHRLDARLKVSLTLILLLIIGLTPMGAFGVYVGYFAIVMAGTITAHLDPWQVIKRSLVALPFAGAAITLVFTVPGPSLGTVPWVGWAISATGMIRFISIMFKSIISVQVAVILMMTTHFTEMLWALTALRVPKVLIAIISFMYRYLFVLVDEAIRLTRARDSRSATPGGGANKKPSVLFRAKITGRMIGSLFARSFERSERVYQAMVARGYQGELRTLSSPPIQLNDVLIAAIPAIIAAGLLVVSFLF